MPRLSREPEDREAAFHASIGGENLGALWVGRRGVDLSRPRMPARPAIWRFDEIRPRLMEAGRLVSAEDAFRRVLVLQNPGFGGAMRATQTLYAGLQLVLPGEIAPCHRHSQTAIRFVVEGSGATTTVDGAALAMAPHDLVVTPQWTWHDHRNRGDEPVIWLDVLDTPLIDALDTVFRETHADILQPLTGSQGGRLIRRAGAAREALDRIASESAPDPCLGWRFRYDDPCPTMAAFLHRLPGGFEGRPRRATDGAVYCVVEGRGETEFEDAIVEWRPHDVFVVPGWCRHRHSSAAGAVLFGVSDLALQERLGLWREQRSGTGGANPEWNGGSSKSRPGRRRAGPGRRGIHSC